jgi:hypothetical protein
MMKFLLRIGNGRKFSFFSIIPELQKKARHGAVLLALFFQGAREMWKNMPGYGTIDSLCEQRELRESSVPLWYNNFE